MGVEIERKFLLAPGAAWRHLPPVPGVLLRQGYLSLAKERTVRLRLRGADRAEICIKGPSRGTVRAEYEYPIPIADAVEMLGSLCEGSIIEKTRHLVPYGGLQFEIDEFHGDNQGLIVVEVELTAPDQVFERPEWLGDEVTHDPRYFNSRLVLFPACRWTPPPHG